VHGDARFGCQGFAGSKVNIVYLCALGFELRGVEKLRPAPFFVGE
jgi:hypothetical protein